MKIHPQLFEKCCLRTDKPTNKPTRIHNLLGEDNNLGTDETLATT